jgi:hypothetical protein
MGETVTSSDPKYRPAAPIPRELQHFLLLDPDQRAEAMRRMAAQGWSDYGIASATRLSVQMVRQLLAERLREPTR